MSTEDRFLTTAELSTKINTPATTLRWWRSINKGPRGVRLGDRKVMYRESDVDQWIQERYAEDSKC